MNHLTLKWHEGIEPQIKVLIGILIVKAPAVLDVT
jgi:hypothetical protein